MAPPPTRRTDGRATPRDAAPPSLPPSGCKSNHEIHSPPISSRNRLLLLFLSALMAPLAVVVAGLMGSLPAPSED